MVEHVFQKKSEAPPYSSNTGERNFMNGMEEVEGVEHKENTSFAHYTLEHIASKHPGLISFAACSIFLRQTLES
ncbi:MAG: hypothetical protein RMK21_02510 [Aquificaceae bacterium]|nr:hypothetical protein [Aquificaceae bacterium]